MKVVCVGDIGVDQYLPSREQRFGGITANFARHAREEFPVDDEIHIVSCIGSDDGADLVRSSLVGAEIDCHISAIPGDTPTQLIELQADGERNFIRYDPGVLNDFEFSWEQREIIARSSALSRSAGICADRRPLSRASRYRDRRPGRDRLCRFS